MPLVTHRNMCVAGKKGAGGGIPIGKAGGRVGVGKGEGCEE